MGSVRGPGVDELLVHEFKRITGEQALREIMQKPDGPEFIEAICSNTDWMLELLDSGPIDNGDRVTMLLYALWSKDPDLATRPIDRSMATACALSQGMRDRTDELMEQRYEYFRDSWDKQLLNTCYEDLRTWERRFLARGAQWEGMNSDESLRFLRTRICWPRADYVKACWQAPYRSFNCFGDTVQGWLYYWPFRGSFNSDIDMTIQVGGVCGALSNLGASAAIANGIPALTMGEPGHCAYAVMTGPDTWTPAYSLHWKRSLHTHMGRRTWGHLQMFQECMGDPERVRTANESRRLAHWYIDQGDDARAEQELRRACRKNPLDESLWIEYLELGRKMNKPRAWWSKQQTAILEQLMPDHPDPAWSLLKNHVYPGLLRKADTGDRVAAFRKFIRSGSGWGSGRWNIESAWNWMNDRVGKERDRKVFMLTSLKETVDSPSIGPTFIAWSQGVLEDDDQLRDEFEKQLLGSLKGSGEGRDAVLVELAGRLLPAAAAEHDLETFQRIGTLASRLSEPRPSLAESGIKPFPGELIGSLGALSIDGPGNRWDSPQHHWGVLQETGGNFHTRVGGTPWFQVELPHFSRINGIILENRNGQLHRANGARILASEDGTTWTTIDTIEGSRKWYRIDLQQERPRARFIRVERDDKCLHFPRVLIYGERES